MTRYRAFISYSHRDAKIAEWLHKALESYRVPSRLQEVTNKETSKLGRIFRDDQELAASDDLSASIKEALTDSSALIVVCSEAAASSKWVNSEITEFRNGPRRPVLCLLTGPQSPETQFPPALDIQRNEPLAANLLSDGRRMALLKLVAGLLGVGLDTVVQRESQKRLRRMAAVTLGALIAATVSISLATYAFLAQQRAVEEAARANREALTAVEVSEFLVGLFQVVDPGEARGNSITAREVLDRGAEKIPLELVDQPVVQSRLTRVMGEVYESLGLYEPARKLLEGGLAVSKAQLGARHPESAATHLRFASLQQNRGDYEFAEKHARTALEIYLELQVNSTMGLQAEVARAREVLALVLTNKAVYVEAESQLRKALTARQVLEGRDSKAYAYTLGLLASLQTHQGQLDEAQRVLADVLAIKQQIYPSPHPEIADTLNELGVVAISKMDLDQAEIWYGQYLAMLESLHPDGHPYIAVALENLGAVYYHRGEHDRTLDLLKRVLDMRRSMYGDAHVFVARTLANMGTVYGEAGRTDEAAVRLGRAVELLSENLGSDHPDVAMTLMNLGRMERFSGDLDAAAVSLGRAVDVFKTSLGPDHVHLATTLNQEGLLRMEMREWDTAEASLSEALEIQKRALGDNNIRTAIFRLDLGTLLLEQHRYVEAEQILLEAHSALTQIADSDHDGWQRVHRALAELYRATDRADLASIYESALE